MPTLLALYIIISALLKEKWKKMVAWQSQVIYTTPSYIFRLTIISQNLTTLQKYWPEHCRLNCEPSPAYMCMCYYKYLQCCNMLLSFAVHAFVCCSGQLEHWVQEHVISMHILVSHKHKVTFLQIASRFWWNIHLFCTGCIIWPGPYPQHRCYQCCWFSNRQHLKTSSTW